MGGWSVIAEQVGLPQPGPEPSSRRVPRADGRELHCLDWGGPGRPVLLLHGGALSAHSWRYLAALLAGEARCVALDLRGHGDSDWAERYRIDDHVEDVRRVAAALRLERPHLVGMSLGGVVSAHAALGPLGEAASLTLVDVAPGVRFGASAQLRSFVGADTVAGGAPALIREARRLGSRVSDAQLFHRYATLIRQNPDGGWRWKHDDSRPFDFDHVLERIAALNERAAGLSMPVLVVRGGRSRILSGKDAAAFAAKCPNGRWREAPRAGHTVQEDDPFALADILRAFWADIERPPS